MVFGKVNFPGNGIQVQFLCIISVYQNLSIFNSFVQVDLRIHDKMITAFFIK